MKVLAEIPARSSPDLRTGTLRRADLEAYGSLLEKLHGPRSVLVTGYGPERRVGATGMAATAAAVGTRAALIECDLLEPGLAEALGLTTGPGLCDYLRGKAEAADILKPVVLAGPGSADATESLVCVVAGGPSAEGPRLFSSGAFARALSGLCETYELVVIDGPPLRDEDSLRALLPLADATVACLGPSESRNLTISVSGLVIQH